MLPSGHGLSQDSPAVGSNRDSPALRRCAFG
jgi:hypothetical protein